MLSGNIVCLPIDLSSLTELEHLGCTLGATFPASNSQLPFPKLKELICWGGEWRKEGSLDLSLCTNLEKIDIDDMHGLSGEKGLTGLDKCSKLVSLKCNRTPVFDGDFSNCKLLNELELTYCSLSSLDVSACTALTTLTCEFNPALSQLNLSHNSQLKELNILQCNLTMLTVSDKPELSTLHCDESKLTTLQLSNLPQLAYLSCEGNELESIDLSTLPCLDFLDCSDNKISVLDLSQTSLSSLFCYHNQMVSLDVSHLSGENLVLYCSPMPTLQYLYIAQGQRIPCVTENRSESNIPAHTTILLHTDTGGNEGTGEEPIG